MLLGRKSSIPLLCFVLITGFLLSSCNSKFGDTSVVQENSDNLFSDEISRSAVNLASPNESESSATSSQKDLSPMKKEIERLSIILAPYFDENSPLFIGKENKKYLQHFISKPEIYLKPLEVDDWETIIRILFFFQAKDDGYTQTPITRLSDDEYIERQYALAGLMQLLSPLYNLSFDEDPESLKKSDEITDIETLTEACQLQVRQAYCIGLADITVDEKKLFRPFDDLTSGEALSMVYRIIDSLGPPVFSKEDGLKVEAAEPMTIVAVNDGLPVEEIGKEYYAYRDTLQKSKSSSNKKKLELLTKAEMIVNMDDDYHDLNLPISLNRWRKILHEVFNIELEKIEPYLAYETGGALPYDVAAISIFKLSFLYGGYEARDASDDELESARAAIPQFDTARDISKFAQMFTSGLLEGLYQMPGFTPQRPVSNSEALLLIKRMVESMKIK